MNKITSLNVIQWLINREYWQWKKALLCYLLISVFMLCFSTFLGHSYIKEKLADANHQTKYSVTNTGAEPINLVLDLSSEQNIASSLSQNNQEIFRLYKYFLSEAIERILIIAMLILLIYMVVSLSSEYRSEHHLFLHSFPVSKRELLSSKLIMALIITVTVTFILFVILLASCYLIISLTPLSIIKTQLNEVSYLMLFYDVMQLLMIQLISKSPIFMLMLFLSVKYHQQSTSIFVVLGIIAFITFTIIIKQLIPVIEQNFSSINLYHEYNYYTEGKNLTPDSPMVYQSMLAYFFTLKMALMLIISSVIFVKIEGEMP